MPENRYYENKALSFAAGRFERGFISGLKNVENDLQIFTCEPYENYPKDKLFVRGKKELITGNMEIQTIGYVNYPVLKHITLFIYLFFKCLYWYLKDLKAMNVIITYNLDTPILQVALFMQKLGVRYVPLISDLPFYNETDRGQMNFRKRLSLAAYRAQFKNIRKPWGSIILNDNVRKDFHLENTILIEGGVSQMDLIEKQSVEDIEHNKEKPFTIFYCGSLDVFHGADKLLEISSLLAPEDFNLIVCGRGNEEWQEKFRNQSDKIGSLSFKGEVGAIELSKMQKSSDLLLIPHPTSLKQLRYQFPSKLMDYALTGTPVLSTPLPGIPNEYKNLVYFSETDSVQDIYRQIIKIKDIPRHTREQFGRHAADYIIKEKNWNRNAQKICDFIRKS